MALRGVLNIDRRVPSRWRLRRAVRKGKNIQFLGLPKNMTVQESLADVLPDITRLHLPGGTSNEDYSFLEGASSLSELSLWDTSLGPIDFTKIPLTCLVLDANKDWVSLKQSQTLKELMLGYGDLSWVPTQSPLEKLVLHSMGRDRDLSRLSAFPQLKCLELHGSGELSLAGIAELTALEEVELTSFASVTGLEELMHLPNLRKLYLEDIKLVDTTGPLYELKKRAWVWVVGTKSWHREFRAVTPITIYSARRSV